MVIGVRAFNVRDDLAAHLPALFAYVEGGGTVVAQYNRPNGLRTNRLAPYDLRLSDARVTDENAPVTFLAPDHPALDDAQQDQRRPTWKAGCRSAASTSRRSGTRTSRRSSRRATRARRRSKGGLLVAKHGRGHFVYTGLVFFRQLPAGVPGAYRLFANLVSLGK